MYHYGAPLRKQRLRKKMAKASKRPRPMGRQAIPKPSGPRTPQSVLAVMQGGVQSAGDAVAAEIAVETALSQKQGQTTQSGMIKQLTPAQQVAKKKALLAERRASRRKAASAALTPKPKSIAQTIQKLQANKAEPAPADILSAGLPSVIRAVKKGADPNKAAKALKKLPALGIAQAKQRLDLLIKKKPRCRPAVKKIQGSRELAAIKLMQQQIMALDKEIRLLNAKNDADTMVKAQSSLANAQTNLSQQIANISIKATELDIEPEAVETLVEAAQAEGALEFEALVGSEIETPDQELAEEEAKDPEEIMQETEAAAIIEQAAEANADLALDSDAPVGITPSDVTVTDQSVAQVMEQKKSGLDQYLTPKNLLLGGLLLGGLYLTMRD